MQLPHVIVDRVGPLAHVPAVGALVPGEDVPALVPVVAQHRIALGERARTAFGAVVLAGLRIQRGLDYLARGPALLDVTLVLLIRNYGKQKHKRFPVSSSSRQCLSVANWIISYWLVCRITHLVNGRPFRLLQREKPSTAPFYIFGSCF
jgi:hypothetical protein